MGLNKQALQHIYAHIQNYVVNGIKWRYILSVSIITLKHVGFDNMVTRHGTTIELNIRVYNFNFVRVPETATFARYKFCTTITSHTILNKATIYMFTNIHYLQVQLAKLQYRYKITHRNIVSRSNKPPNVVAVSNKYKDHLQPPQR